MNFFWFRFQYRSFFFCDFRSTNATNLCIFDRLSNVAIRNLLSLQHSMSFWIFQDGSNLQNCLLWLLWTNITKRKMFTLWLHHGMTARFHIYSFCVRCLFFIYNCLWRIFFNWSFSKRCCDYMFFLKIQIHSKPRRICNRFDILNFIEITDKLYSFCPKFFAPIHHCTYLFCNMQLFNIFSPIRHCCFVVLQQDQRHFVSPVNIISNVILCMTNRQFPWFDQLWIHSFANLKLHQKHWTKCNFFLIVHDRFDYIQKRFRLDQIMLATRQFLILQEWNRFPFLILKGNHLFLRSPLAFFIKNKTIFFREFVTLFWNNYKTIDLKHNNPKQFKRFVVVELNVFGSNNDRRNNIKFKILLAILLKPPFD